MSETSSIYPCKRNTMRRSPHFQKDRLYCVFLFPRSTPDSKRENFFLAFVAKKLREIKFHSLYHYLSQLESVSLPEYPRKATRKASDPHWPQTARALWKLSRGLLLTNNNTQNHWLSEFTDMRQFSHPESRNKISNIVITKLFYSHILNMNRCSLHTRTYTTLRFSIQMIKMALQARKVSGAFKKRAHGDGKYLWCNSLSLTCRRWPLQSYHNQHTPLVPPEASDVQRSSLEPCTTYHPQYNEHSITFLQNNIDQTVTPNARAFALKVLWSIFAPSTRYWINWRHLIFFWDWK